LGQDGGMVLRRLFLAVRPAAAGALWPMVEVREAEAVPGRGLAGDRCFDGADGGEAGVVCAFSLEVLGALQRELSAFQVEPWALRCNLFTEGANLAEWVGRRFRIGGVEVEGLGLRAVEPWMEAVVPGAGRWLEGRAGLRLRLVGAGMLRVVAEEGPRLPSSGQRLAEQWPEHEWE
jgi:MOSC domain-containing protein YiiM